MTTTKNLERHYDGFINSDDPFDFFKGLAAYVEYVLSVPVLKEEFDNQMSERRVLIKEVEQAEKKTRQELNKAKAKLLALVDKTGLDIKSFNRYQTMEFGKNADMLQEIAAFESKDEKKRAVGSVFVSDEVEKYLFDIAANLLKAGYEKELKEFLVSSKEYAEYYRRINGRSQYTHTGNQYGNFIFSKTWAERWEKVAQFERERTFKLWGSFETLLQFRVSYDCAQTNTGLDATPPGGTEDVDWFGAAKEGVRIFEMGRELQQLSEDKMYFSRVADARSFVKRAAGELKTLKRDELKSAAEAVHRRLVVVVGEESLEESTKGVKTPYKGLKSIDLVTHSLEPKGVIFLVLDEEYQIPIRCEVKNSKGDETYIKKLYNIAYFVDAPNKKVDYDRYLSDNINNGLFKKRAVAKYMKTNGLKKPTLVQKSENNTLVLKNEIPVKTILVKSTPSQHQSLYIDKTN